MLDTVRIFGVERCMFASNFPVDGPLRRIRDHLHRLQDDRAEDFAAAEQRRLFHDNAVRIYRLEGAAAAD